MSGSRPFFLSRAHVLSVFISLFKIPFLLKKIYSFLLFIFVVQSFSHVQFFVTPWTAACQASLSFTVSWSLLKLMSVESVMPSNHLILCNPLLPLPSVFPSIKVFSNEMALHIYFQFFNWRKIALYCCVGFRHTTMRNIINYIYIYIYIYTHIYIHTHTHIPPLPLELLCPPKKNLRLVLRGNVTKSLLREPQ